MKFMNSMNYIPCVVNGYINLIEIRLSLLDLLPYMVRCTAPVTYSLDVTEE